MLISSLECSSYPISELIVVDNSDDGSMSGFFDRISKGVSYEVIYFKSKRNLGFGKGVNLAARIAGGDVLFIVNPDLVLDESCVERLLKFLLYNNITVVEARQLPFEHPKFYNPVNLDTFWCSGCCMMLKRDDFLNIGGFDDNIFLYAEDVDLSWRIKLSGGRVAYVPSAVVYHNPYSERRSISKYLPVSDFYLRVKYGASIRRWFNLCGSECRKKIGFVNLFISFLKALLAKKRLENGPSVSFFRDDFMGYEPIRRRGFDVSTPHLLCYPKVTVIVNSFGRRDVLYRFLRMMSNQIYDNINVLIVGEISNSLNIAKEFPDLECRFLECDVASVESISDSIGDYFLFLRDCDLLFCDAVEMFVSYAEATKKPVVCAGGFEFGTGDGVSGVLRHGYFGDISEEEQLFPFGTFLISKRYLDRLEPLFHLGRVRLKVKAEDVVFIPKDLSIYCVGG